MMPLKPEPSRRARATDPCRDRRRSLRVRGACLLVASLAGASLAQAQSSASVPPKSDSLTWNGITLYGTVDIGLQYDTHGVPANDYFPGGTEPYIQKNSKGSITAVTPSNLSSSRIGLSGSEPIGEDWAGVFRLETFFNPQSGELTDALKSLTQNNGRALAAQTANIDGSVAGQLFGGAAYAGFNSPTYGTFTFGRHVTTLADGIVKYDAMSSAQAFSLIGIAGLTAGGGTTEDRRLDQSLKYIGKYGWAHLGALYQFSGSRGSTNTAYQVSFGGDFAGASADAYYFKKYNAVAASALSAAQVGQLTVTGTPPVPGPLAGSGLTVSNSLAATVSDNTSYAVMGLYPAGAVKLFAGYEHIKFENPTNPYSVGQDIIGGYKLAVVINTAYTSSRTLQVFWAGVKYAATPDLDLVASYYGYRQNSFATGLNAGCSSAVSAACSGTLAAVGLLADYRFSKRFDGYAGALWTQVKDGLANGYLNTSTTATTVGVRFRF